MPPQKFFRLRGRQTEQPDDRASAYAVITNVQRQAHLSVSLLRAMFPDYQPPPSDPSGFQAALAGLQVGLADLDNVRSFLDGQSNPLGFDPNFLFLIKPFETVNFDTYDVMKEWTQVLLDDTQIKYLAARQSYDNFIIKYESQDSERERELSSV